MSSPTEYSVQQCGDMFNREPRMDANLNVLRRALTPACRELDVGARTEVAFLIPAHFPDLAHALNHFGTLRGALHQSDA